MRVVLTRPDQDAAEWSQALQVRGHQTLLLPLISIGAAPDPAKLARAWERLADYGAVMFVSANAARQFRAAAPSQPWPATTRAWATGPGTTAALEAAGVPASLIDSPPPQAPQFDSEALWVEVAAQAGPGWRVLILRGADAGGRMSGRDWLARQLEQAGAQVDSLACYTRRLPAWSATQRADAERAASDGSVWLFSSSEALDNLRRLLPHCSWSRARAIATHERIARAAADAGFGVVWPSRPGLEGMMAALESSG